MTKEEILQELSTWGAMGGAGLMGRLILHAKQVQQGKRKPLTWALFWDLPIGIGMGWIGLGLGTWLNVKWEVTVSIGMAISYLGPYAIDKVFEQIGKWKGLPDAD